MQRLPQIILTLAFVVASAQGQAPALLVSECVARNGLCEFQQLVKYRFRSDKPISREVVFIGPVSGARYDLGENHIYRGRYLITHWADVIDIEKKQLLHTGTGELVDIEGDRVIQKVQRTDVRGLFYYDLKSGKYARLRSPGKWALPGLLSPDQTKSAAVEESGSGKIWLHRLKGTRRLLASDLRASVVGCSLPKPPVLWLDNQKLLTQSADGKLVVVDMRGRLTPLLSLPIKSERGSPHLYRNDAGRIIYEFGSETYAIDVENKQYSLVDTRWSDLGSGFEWASDNSAFGRVIRYQQQEIGRWWSLSTRTTAGHIAVEYGDVGHVFGIPKGLKVWSSSNKTWTTIDPAWLNKIIGWIDDEPPNQTAAITGRVKRFDSDLRAAEVELFSFEFLRPYLGREGPNFTEIEGEPSAGAQYLVNAELFRQEAVATAKFELVDQRGNVIQLLHFVKQENSLNRDRYVGTMKVPNRPFRVAVSGMGVDGQPYRHVYERLFRPTTRPPLPPLLPPRLTPTEKDRMTRALIALEKETLAETEKITSKNADGVIVIPRIEVSNMIFGPLVSQKGNTIGMQLTYDIRFSADGDYAHSLQVSPFYQDPDMRGVVEMAVISEEINPRPSPPSYARPEIYVDMNTLVQYGSEAWYKAGVVYRFTVKLVPNFVGQNANKTKFCVDEEHYKYRSKSLSFWQTMMTDRRPVKYQIFINELAYAGETELFEPPKTYYDGFRREGAVKCKPYKNSNF